MIVTRLDGRVNGWLRFPQFCKKLSSIDVTPLGMTTGWLKFVHPDIKLAPIAVRLEERVNDLLNRIQFIIKRPPIDVTLLGTTIG